MFFFHQVSEVIYISKYNFRVWEHYVIVITISTLKCRSFAIEQQQQPISSD